MKIQSLFTMALLSITPLVNASMEDEGQSMIARYQQALESRDTRGLEELIDPQANIRITSRLDDGDRIVITLTRPQFLQHMRALWRFATEERYSLRDLHWSVGTDQLTVSLVQEERYLLFGEQLEQINEISLNLDARDGQLRIRSILVEADQW